MSIFIILQFLLNFTPIYSQNLYPAKSLRSDSENIANLSFTYATKYNKKSDENAKSISESYSTINNSILRTRCAEAINGSLGPKRCQSSINSKEQRSNLALSGLKQLNNRDKTPIANFSNKKTKKINNIYELLRQVEYEADFSKVPMKKRMKNWIRSIDDLL